MKIIVADLQLLSEKRDGNIIAFSVYLVNLSLLPLNGKLMFEVTNCYRLRIYITFKNKSIIRFF